jgi:steroid 5-alpha reductase family enzyme
MWQDFLLFLGISIGFNLAMFLVAYKLQTDKITDISYSATFITSVLGMFLLRSSNDVVDFSILILILFWATRLGTYLLVRIHTMGQDNRFDNIRNSFKSFLSFWIVQGFSVTIICIPIILSFNIADKELSTIGWLGIGIAIIGFLIETIADMQKYSFKKENPDTFIQSGLWTYIRHPNYLGEILFWIGVFLISISGFENSIVFFGAISPLWIIFLLLKFSGIPPLEKKWAEKYKDNNQFQVYYKRSYRLIPGIY